MQITDASIASDKIGSEFFRQTYVLRFNGPRIPTDLLFILENIYKYLQNYTLVISTKPIYLDRKAVSLVM